jgi:hypothetical protein
VLTSGGQAQGDRFGTSVDISEDVVVVGTASVAYVFGYDANSKIWAQKTTLTADGEPESGFGTSVAIDGDIVVVGSPDVNNGRGAVYIFEYNRSNLKWEQTAKLTAIDGRSDAYFGSSVAVAGDVVAVGAHGDSNYKGAVYIFRKNAANTWDQKNKFTSTSIGGEFFGHSVAMSGSILVAGAPNNRDNGWYSGASYIFEYNQLNDTWKKAAKLTAHDGEPYEQFGGSVAVHQNTAVIGAFFDDDKGTNSGSAYIFLRDEASGTWEETAKLTANDGEADAWFGYSVGISGNDDVIVGAPYNDAETGAVYIFSSGTINGLFF